MPEPSPRPVDLDKNAERDFAAADFNTDTLRAIQYPPEADAMSRQRPPCNHDYDRGRTCSARTKVRRVNVHKEVIADADAKRSKGRHAPDRGKEGTQ